MLIECCTQSVCLRVKYTYDIINDIPNAVGRNV